MNSQRDPVSKGIAPVQPPDIEKVSPEHSGYQDRSSQEASQELASSTRESKENGIVLICVAITIGGFLAWLVYSIVILHLQ